MPSATVQCAPDCTALGNGLISAFTDVGCVAGLTVAETCVGYLIQRTWPLHMTAGVEFWTGLDSSFLPNEGMRFRVGLAHQLSMTRAHLPLLCHDLLDASCRAGVSDCAFWHAFFDHGGQTQAPRG